MRTSIISLDPQTIAYGARDSRATRRSVHCMVGDREDSTTSRRVHIERFDSQPIVEWLRGTVGLSPSVPDVGLRPSSALLIQGALASSQRARRESLTQQINSTRTRACRSGGCDMRTWFNVSEAAEYAGVSRDTIYTACEQGELRSARVSGRRAIRIRPAWIDAWLERHAPDVQDRRRIGDTQNGGAS